MSSFVMLDNTTVPTKLRSKPILLAGIVALAMCVSAGDNLAHARKPAETYGTGMFSSGSAQTPHQQIKETLKNLEYSNTVAESFTKMVRSWKEVHGQPALVSLSERLSRSRKAFSRGEISEGQLAKIEERIIIALGKSIRKKIAYRSEYFDLADIVEDEVANCFGYSQMLYVLGNSIGLSAHIASVAPEHIANIVFLVDGTMTIIDLTMADDLMGEYIIKGKRLDGNSTHWVLDGKSNLAGGNNTIHIFSRNELIGEIHFCRGTVNYMSGQGVEAISHYDRAIKLNPKSAKAYSNRGGAHLLLNEHSRAISDFNDAIEINPEFTSACHNRGNAYLDSGQYAKAIRDYTHTIELNPDFVKAYFGRGHAHLFLEHYTQAVSDYTKVVELVPDFARAYYMRAICNAYLVEDEKANRDMLRAVELDRKLKTEVEEMSKELELDLTSG